MTETTEPVVITPEDEVPDPPTRTGTPQPAEAPEDDDGEADGPEDAP